METKDNVITISADERAEYEAFRAAREKQRAEEERAQAMSNYATLVDDEVFSAVEQLRVLSEEMSVVKATIFENFRTIIAMKQEVLGRVRDGGQYTHTFTNSDGTRRIALGNRTIEDYRDTVDDGIAMVTDYLRSLAKDEESASLVAAVMKLLERDKHGRIKASRVLQLGKMAADSKDELFIEGVKIIQDAYQPSISKAFIEAYTKEEGGGWEAVPLSMTRA